MTGRDIKDKVLHLESENEIYEWIVTSIDDGNEVKFPEDIVFHKFLEFLEKENEFNGTPTEFKNKLLETCSYEISEKVVMKKLIKYKEFFALKNINFFNSRSGTTRKIFLKKMN